jgi:DNA-binding XRE family transcriptional regulator
MNKQHPEKTLENVVRELAKLRKAKGLSHEKLAQKIGVHRTAISLIERGKRSPTLVVCIKMANGLGVKLGDILNSVET